MNIKTRGALPTYILEVDGVVYPTFDKSGARTEMSCAAKYFQIYFTVTVAVGRPDQ